MITRVMTDPAMHEADTHIGANTADSRCAGLVPDRATLRQWFASDDTLPVIVGSTIKGPDAVSADDWSVSDMDGGWRTFWANVAQALTLDDTAPVSAIADIAAGVRPMPTASDMCDNGAVDTLFDDM